MTPRRVACDPGLDAQPRGGSASIRSADRDQSVHEPVLSPYRTDLAACNDVAQVQPFDT